MVKVWATGIYIPTHQVRNSLSFISKRLKSVNISHSKITKWWWGLLRSTTIYPFIYFRKRRKPEFSSKQDFDHPIFLALYFFMFPVRKNNWWKQWRYSCGPIPSLSGIQIWPLSYLLLLESTAWVGCSEYFLYLGPITEAWQGRIMKQYLPSL